jgi:zinc transporter ZupT
MAAAVAIIVLSLRGTYRRVRGLFVVTAILGVVGILGAVISVAALVHTRRARPTR